MSKISRRGGVSKKPRKPQKPWSSKPLAGAEGAATRWASRCVVLTLVSTGYVFWPTLRDGFRLPKLVAAQCLGLVSVLLLTSLFKQRPRWTWRDLAASSALRFLGPIVFVAALSVVVSGSAAAGRKALWSLAVAVLCAVVWSHAGFCWDKVARQYALSTLPVAALAMAQSLGAWNPLGTLEAGRLTTTSLIGNVGELAGYLVVPILVAVAAAWQSSGAWRNALGWSGVALVLAVAMLLTGTVAATVGLGGGLVILFWLHFGARRRIALVVGLALVAGSLATAPLPSRFDHKRQQLMRGEWNALLTGRLDGYRVAAELFRQHPVAGVGLGGYAAHFVSTKEALLERGVTFYPLHGERNFFSNAHNDLLEFLAEAGVLGALAVGWALWGAWWMWRGKWVRRIVDEAVPPQSLPAKRATTNEPEDKTRRGVLGPEFLAASWGALLLIAMAHFPFRLATMGFAAVMLLAWLFDPERVRA